MRTQAARVRLEATVSMNAYDVYDRLLIRGRSGEMLREATLEEALRLTVALAKERSGQARAILVRLADTLSGHAVDLLNISDAATETVAAIDGKSVAPIIQAAVETIRPRLGTATLPPPISASAPITKGPRRIWTPERVEELNRLYAEGGLPSVRAGFPEFSDTTLRGAFTEYLRPETRQALRARKAERGVKPMAAIARVVPKPIDAALDRAFDSPARQLPTKPPELPTQAPELPAQTPEIGRLVEPLRNDAREAIPKSSPAPYSPKPRPRVNPFRPVPKLRALAAEEKPLPIRAPRLEASDLRLACLACGATAFTLPIDPRDPQGPRECRSSSDCAKRQARGGVAAMKSAPLPGPHAGVVPSMPRSPVGYGR